MTAIRVRSNSLTLCWFCPALLFCLTGAGCRGTDYPETVPVKGQVTFDGGLCPNSGSLYFTPVEAAPGFPMRPALADFGTDGNFTAKTFNPGDGLLPGKYQVRVECWEVPPNMEGKPVKSHVPEKYQNAATSGLEINVPPRAAPQELKFDILRKQAAK